MKILIYRFAKGGKCWADAPVADWYQRVQRRLPVEEIRFKPAADRDTVPQRQQLESAKLLGKIRPGDRLIVIDERGEQATTEQFAGWIQQSMNQGVKRIVFAIGGPFGHSPVLREKAWKVLCLSSMVLNHELARMVLSEQLYRVTHVIWGGKYHH